MKTSAGLLMYRINGGQLEFFLVHPGGPYFAKKNEGAWTIPKGEPVGEEELLETAKREFVEETGIIISPPLIELGTVKQKGGKVVYAWAFKGEWNETLGIKSNLFEIQWPPKSGQFKSFPEIDKAGFFTIEKAKILINPAQIEFLYSLKEKLNL